MGLCGLSRWAGRLYAAAQTLPDGKTCAESFHLLRGALTQLGLAPERASVLSKVLEILEQPMIPLHHVRLGALLGLREPMGVA